MICREPASELRRSSGRTLFTRDPQLRLFNTLTRRVEPFVPLTDGEVRMYTCGPTVYRAVHLGNLRSYLLADWLRRTFASKGWRVTHVKNITDVGHMRQDAVDRGEDKVIAAALAEGRTPMEIAATYEERFREDERELGILPATVYPRATAHVPEMVAMIEQLVARGLAYAVDGTVYYAVKRFPGYGRLSGNVQEALKQGVRVDVDPQKRDPSDFALWKRAEPGRVALVWPAPWSDGYPGWHIECSAMSTRYLGERFDLHTGGVDNIFPHHEDEIAQSEGFTGKPFVNYWVHAQHLLADGQKMAKSTGNAYTRAEIEARGFHPLALRYFYTTALYRSRLNFTFRALQAAQTSLERLRDRAYALLLTGDRPAALTSDPLPATPWQAALLEAVENDLNFPRAMALVWKMLRTGQMDASQKVRLLLDF